MYCVVQKNHFWMVLLLLWVGGTNPGVLCSQEAIFSGPQVGEALPSFEVLGVLDDSAGKKINFVENAGDRPIVLVFVHDVNRQSISMTRVLTNYTTSRSMDGLQTGVVWLDEDRANGEATIRRVRHALAKNAPIGVSMDGREGPGSYGLNRKVMLTILVGKNRKVSANYALIQPSLQVDLPKILRSITEVVGGEPPSLESLLRSEGMANAVESQGSVNLRTWLAPLIQRDATDEQIDKAANDLDQFLKSSVEAQKEIARITQTIISAGKLENYGRPLAQRHLKRWLDLYGTKSDGTTIPNEKSSNKEP
ncbi:MAG: hypothetical protein KGQ60_16840 [Planctomycetes bacterium]|nr:hypothetical protein [Planctomycetota bacterium]